MDEWSRIVIENYCNSHNSKKSRFLSKLVELSYDMSSTIDDEEAIYLQRLIWREKDEELKRAMIDLEGYFMIF